MLSMRRFINKGIAVAVMAAMVVTLAPAQNAGAAKKVKLSRTSASITVGKTKKLSVKNGKKKAKVTWKTSKKKIAKIVQKTSKGNKATAKIKGLKKGSAVITASYKLGKKTTKLTCKVTVKNADLVVTPTTVPTVTTAPGTATPLVKPTEPIKKPTETPKNTITNTPRPTSTPTAAPINGSIEAYKVGTEKVITVDGKVTEEAWEDTEAFNVLNNVNSVRGTTSITAATANAMWDDGAFYISAVVTKPEVSATDIVNLFFDEDSKAEGDYKENANAINIKIPVNGTASAVSNGSAYTWEAKAVSNATGYVVEAKVMLKDVTPEVDGKFSFDLQLNDGTASVTYFDAIKDVVYDKENDVWNLTDMGVRVAADTSFMGEVILVPSMAQATTAYYTANGERSEEHTSEL